MPWSHDTCKSDDNCNLFMFRHRLCICLILYYYFDLLSTLSSLNSFLDIERMEMKNFRVRETRTSSPTVHESCELTLPAKLPTKHKNLQGIISTETESMSGADWTDEKHSLYLKSMEASFVNQLYDSKEMFGWRSPNSTTTSSGQFKVLRGGCWQRINVGRNNSDINRTNECHDLKVNPWIQHFRSSTKHRATAIAHPTLEDSTTSTSQVVDLSGRKEIIYASETVSMRDSHQDMSCNDTEMSDQNFVDEEVEGEKENNRSNTKRMKSSIAGNDQIVPISNLSSTGDVTVNCVIAAENIR